MMQPVSMEDWIGRILDDEDLKILLVFGQFVTEYATIESWCHYMFQRYSEIPEDMSRAIAGGMRFADLLPLLGVAIKSTTRTLGEEERREFAVCINQLSHLTALRHRLVHRGFHKSLANDENRSVIPGEFISHNARTAKSREAFEALRFNVDDIKAAMWDAARIHQRLQFIGVQGGLAAVKKSLEPQFWQLIYGPWFYKPVQPEKPAQKPRSTPE